MTIHASVTAARHRLRLAGLSPAEADIGARLLAQHVVGWEAAQFLTSSRQPAPDGFAARYDPLVARRAAREPLPYITGRREFWDLTFEVSPAVLIPSIRESSSRSGPAPAALTAAASIPLA